jgi:hypothetical protein
MLLMTNAPHAKLNAAQCRYVAQFAKLRHDVMAFNLELGAEFARSGSDGWKRHGLNGLKAACWSLAQTLREIPGGWDLYERASLMLTVPA